MSMDDKNTIPSWLLEKAPEPATGKLRSTGFLTRTLRSVSSVFENEFFCERYASRAGLLQAIDPRVKLCALLLFLLLSAFSAKLVVLAALGMTAVFYAGLSRLPLKDYIRRVWGYLPAAVFVFSLPGASSLFIHGAPLFYLIKPGVFGLGDGLYFTAPGLAAVLRLCLRTGVSLSFCFLLLLTTRFSKLMQALSSLHVPSSFISVLNMAYRYIFVISSMAGAMTEARFLRTVGKLPSSDNRRFVGRSLAALFIKSHFISEEIYDAMVCRGFSGKILSVDDFHIRASDIVFLINTVLILLLLLVGDWLL